MLAGVGVAMLAMAGCSQQPPPQELTQVNNLSHPGAAAPPKAKQQNRLANISVPEAASPPEDGQWTMPSRDYANTRLQLAFTFATGTLLGQESAPIVVG